MPCIEHAAECKLVFNAELNAERPVFSTTVALNSRLEALIVQVEVFYGLRVSLLVPGARSTQAFVAYC